MINEEMRLHRKVKGDNNNIKKDIREPSEVDKLEEVAGSTNIVPELNIKLT